MWWMWLLWVSVMLVLSVGCYVKEAHSQEKPSRLEASRMLAKIEPTVNRIRIDDLSERASKLEVVNKDIKVKLNMFDKKATLITGVTFLSLLAIFLHWRSSLRQEKRLNVVGDKRHQEAMRSISDLTGIVRIIDKPIDIEVDVSVTMGEERYVVVCRHFRDDEGNECWISPFLTDTDRVIQRDTRKFLANSLKGCLTRTTFSEQKRKLMKKKKIKKVS
jgi:hypothetical protein